MTSTPLQVQPGHAPAGAPVRRRVPAADLELFWPSRRGHAFDEFCR